MYSSETTYQQHNNTICTEIQPVQHSNSEVTTNKTIRVTVVSKKTFTRSSPSLSRTSNIDIDDNVHVYDADERLDSKNVNICQFERNPDFETTTRARLNPKHVDERTRIVQDPTNKNSQAVRCWWHVRRYRVGPYSGKSSGGSAGG